MTDTTSSSAFEAQVAPLVNRMPLVQGYLAQFGELKGRWDTLTLLAQLSGLKLDTQSTRDAFAELSAAMLNRLAIETFSRTTQGLEQKANAAIDVLTRNLYERTADIGFLATDAEIVAFCRACDRGEAPDPQALAARFAQYVLKYSVYKNVVLFAPDGRLLASLAPCAVERSSAPLIAQALRGDAYVETFARTDFLPDETTLTYAARVADGGRAIGVLVLVFNVHTEAEAIFRSLASEDEVLVFMDGDERVLLSSEPYVVPVGAKVPHRGPGQQIKMAARRLLAAKARPRSYQGYAGPGWSAMAVVPVDEAFQTQPAAESVQLAGGSLFSEQLLSIPHQAEDIQHRLNRLVWNGRLQQGAKSDDFARALLQEIASVGAGTRSLFDAAIRNLRAVAVATVREEALAAAVRAVDILDRNLYERACDSRWWAEAPELVHGEPQRCAEILSGINDLYTVYTEILLFDPHGVVLASSRAPERCGHALDAEWVPRVLACGANAYAVSRFVSTPLYGDRPTYVYGAALREGEQAVRGVALVFDAAPQFEAMLAATLPRQPGTVAAFVLPDRTLLGQTGTLPLPLPDQVHALKPGERYSGLVEHAGLHYAVGAAAGAGYREFKTSDGYRETVIAATVVPCGPAATDVRDMQFAAPADQGGTEIAIFKVNGHWMASLTADTEACIELGASAKLPSSPKDATNAALGVALNGADSLPIVDLAGASARDYRGRPAVVLRYQGRKMALVCEALGPVCLAQIRNLDQLREGTAVAEVGDVLVEMVSLESLWKRVREAAPDVSPAA